jgi:hypothetical protein
MKSRKIRALIVFAIRILQIQCQFQLENSTAVSRAANFAAEQRRGGEVLQISAVGLLSRTADGVHIEFGCMMN